MATVRTKKQLAEAAQEGQNHIIIEGDLVNGVYRIKIIRPIAWGVALVAISGAVYLSMATPAATIASTPLGGVISFTAASTSAAAAVTILGLNDTIVAIGIAVFGGGVGVLTTLRSKYTVEEKSSDRLVLKKKIRLRRAPPLP